MMNQSEHDLFGLVGGANKGFIIVTKIETRLTLAKPSVSNTHATGDSIVPTICLPKLLLYHLKKSKKPPIRA